MNLRRPRAAPHHERAVPQRTRAVLPSGWERFYVIVRRIPRGRVTTYAGVAALAGNPRLARHVGFALAALKETATATAIPWHRVLGAKGRGRAIVSIKDPIGGSLQRRLLEQEGVVFEARGTVSLEHFGWKPRPPARRSGASERSRA